MSRIAFFACFGLAVVSNSTAFSAEGTPAKKQRLRVILDADGNVEITPTTADAQRSDKKLVITCERVRIKSVKKGQSSFEMVFVGAVRMVSRNSHFQAKRLILSIPDGVKSLLRINGN